eukprot:2855469-Prymnesium_polylepis.1
MQHLDAPLVFHCGEAQSPRGWRAKAQVGNEMARALRERVRALVAHLASWLDLHPNGVHNDGETVSLREQLLAALNMAVLTAAAELVEH